MFITRQDIIVIYCETCGVRFAMFDFDNEEWYGSYVSFCPICGTDELQWEN